MPQCPADWTHDRRRAGTLWGWTHHRSECSQSSHPPPAPMEGRGQRWAMLTAYDQYAAQIFDEAGIPVLLVGDSACNNVYGNETSLPVTVDELIPLVRAVTRSVTRALVVGDLPFGSYQATPEQAYDTSVRFMKEAGATRSSSRAAAEMAPAGGEAHRRRHPGDGAHRLHAAVRAQPRRLPGPGPRRRRATRMIDDALALRSRRVRRGDGDGPRRRRRRGDQASSTSRRSASAPAPDCDAQVLVWQDMAGLRTGRAPRFVKRTPTCTASCSRPRGSTPPRSPPAPSPAPEHSF